MDTTAPESENNSTQNDSFSIESQQITKEKTSSIYSYLRNPKILMGLAATVFLLAFLIVMAFTLPNTQKKNEVTKIATSNPQLALDKARQEKENAEKAALEAAKPINRLQKAFDEVIGSNSLKKKLSLDEAGVATIDYVIVSSDGQVILKKSFENFADLAVKVFSIEQVNKLSVSSYATKFTDQFGQPNLVAVKLEINRETNSKINWPVKKFVYKDYATIANVHEINSQLSKDYQNLIKAK